MTTATPDNRQELLLLWEQLQQSEDGTATNSLLQVMKKIPELRIQAWTAIARDELSPDDLTWIVTNCPALATSAGMELLQRFKNDVDHLRTVLLFIPDLAELAWQAINNIDGIWEENQLLQIILRVNAFRWRAWAKLLEIRASNKCLIAIITSVGELRNEAWCLLMKQKPTPAELASVMLTTPELREVTWTAYLAQNPSNDDLAYVAANIDSMRDKAWTQLRMRPDNGEQLCRIIRNVPPLREEAAGLLLSSTCSDLELAVIVGNVPEHSNEAGQRLLLASPTLDQLRIVRCYASSLAETTEELIATHPQTIIDRMAAVV